MIAVTNLPSDKDNVRLSATSKFFSIIKFSTLLFTQIYTKYIANLSYFHQFGNVIIPDANKSFSKYVTYLTFCNYFNKTINNCIPNSVIHLTFGYYFNQSINSCIPDSITHLTFGPNFNQTINDCIPDSVIHLTFGCDFNRPINCCISESVTNLTFGYYFDQNIDELPTSINNISLRGSYKREISERIMPKVTIR